MTRAYHRNPRQITQKRLDKLRTNLAQYGDLAGIVHDLNSNEIISGNQRMRAINLDQCQIELTYEREYPDVQGTVAQGYAVWQGNRYAYRQVRWPPEVCEKANLVANLGAGAWDWDALSGWTVPLLDVGFDDDLFADWRRDVEALGSLMVSEYVQRYEPQITNIDYTDDDIKRAAHGMGITNGEKEMLEVICPHCAEIFFVSLNDNSKYKP
jgi:hypothetical protein